MRHALARIIYTDMSGVEQTIAIDSNYPIVTVGRAVDCDIRSNRKSVSRHHAEFKFSNNQVHVLDLNSSNGTFIIIDDQRRAIIGQQTITTNDEIWCGDFVLRYLADTAEPEKRAPIPTFTSSPDGGFPNQTSDRPQSGSQPLGLGLTAPPQFPTDPPPGLLEQSGFSPNTDDIDEIERLMAEKSSIEDLATRQAEEIDRLESLIGSVKEDAANSALMLQTQKEKTEQEKKKLEEQLSSQKADGVVIDLENEVVELRAMNDKLRQELSENGEEIKNTFEGQLRENFAEIDTLGKTNEKLVAQNSELSTKLDDALTEAIDLKAQIEVFQQKLSSTEKSLQADSEWETKLTTLEREKNALQTANDALNQQSQDRNLTILDLKDQVLQLEREKESIEAQFAREKEAIETEFKREKEALESKPATETPASSNPELVTFLTSLERLTDAIQRTDFSALSTVDRVRLQSAIRETKPKSTLQAFIEKHK